MTKRKAPRRIKVGKCWYVAGYDGKPIVGLSWDKANDYFYPTHFKKSDYYKKNKKRPNFSKDYDTALMLFRQFENGDDQFLHVDTIASRPRSPEELSVLNEMAAEAGITDEDLRNMGIDRKIYWSRFII